MALLHELNVQRICIRTSGYSGMTVGASKVGVDGAGLEEADVWESLLKQMEGGAQSVDSTPHNEGIVDSIHHQFKW